MAVPVVRVGQWVFVHPTFLLSIIIASGRDDCKKMFRLGKKLFQKEWMFYP
jgi:hydrogenase maturation factor